MIVYKVDQPDLPFLVDALLSSNQFDSGDEALYDLATRVKGPSGSLPLTEDMLRERPSGRRWRLAITQDTGRWAS